MTTTDTRPNQRDLILDTALRLMSAHGAAGMSMRALASACGVQVAAIYHYFDSKDALLAAVVDERRYGARLGDPIPVDPGSPPSVRLRMLFLHVWQGALEEEQVWRLVLGEGIRGEATVVPVGANLLGLVTAAARDWITEHVPEAEPHDEVADVLVGQLLAGFVKRVFDSGRDPDLVATSAADSLVATVFGPVRD